MRTAEGTGKLYGIECRKEALRLFEKALTKKVQKII